MNSISANSTQAPIFLVGAERSGTTLLRLMLDSHPLVSFNEEFEYSVGRMGKNGEFPDLRSYRDFLRMNRIFLASGFSVNPSLDYPTLVRGFLQQKLERDQKVLVGATVHHHFDRLLYLWPDARFIHLIRDPRDVAKSAIGMGWAGNVWTGSKRWIEAEETWDLLASRIPRERWVELRYESLIQNPRLELERLCSFIGIAFDEHMFEYAGRSTYTLPDPKLVYQWRTTMLEDDIRLVEARTGPMLESRGYAASGLPCLEVDSVRVRQLEWQSVAHCRRFRMKRYGLPLLFGMKAAKLLPFRRLQDYFQAKVNSVDLELLR